MSAEARPVVVDTNVLVAATDRSRASHDAALALLNTDARPLALTPQIVREYLVVASRPVSVNGLGMAAGDALRNIEDMLNDMRLLDEGAGSLRELARLLAAPGAEGKQIHDANVVAVALAHDASAIVTDNVRHFERFRALISIEPLG